MGFPQGSSKRIKNMPSNSNEFDGIFFRKPFKEFHSHKFFYIYKENEVFPFVRAIVKQKILVWKSFSHIPLRFVERQAPVKARDHCFSTPVKSNGGMYSSLAEDFSCAYPC